MAKKNLPTPYQIPFPEINWVKLLLRSSLGMFLHEIPRAAFSTLEKTNWILILKLFLFHSFKRPLDIKPCNNPIATG